MSRPEGNHAYLTAGFGGRQVEVVLVAGGERCRVVFDPEQARTFADAMRVAADTAEGNPPFAKPSVGSRGQPD